MINWDNIKYDIRTAKSDFMILKNSNSLKKNVNIHLEMVEIHDLLVEAKDIVCKENNINFEEKWKYTFDLTFGLKLYQILSEETGFTDRVASNDEIWRYLSICVIPEIVHLRWGWKKDHFYEVPKLIWLKTIWWYIHLSWRGNEKDTYDILKGKSKSTDTILQVTQRPGIGYYLDVYREIMFKYAEFDNWSRDDFRKVLKLNIARLPTTSPELVEGGINAYVKDLFGSVVEK